MSPQSADTAVMVVCGLALLAAMTVVQAETLADPTRPPPAIERPSATDAGETQVRAPAGLQTIILRAGNKPAAIINGEYVLLGGQVGDAKVIKVGEDFVTLKSPAGRETLKLIPGVEKSPAISAEKIAKKAAGKPAGKEVEK